MAEIDFSEEKLKRLLNPHKLMGQMKLRVGIRRI
jgi:hypothetical protein